MDTNKPRAGRPALPEDQRTFVTSVRLTKARSIKLRQLGSARLNAWIDRAKVGKKTFDKDR